MSNQNTPLVSVPVITYNSSKYVLETLDSIYAQTYQNIELIISDDCSTDNTVQICEEWIAAHKERFVRTEIITVSENTGISANSNRGHNACRGEWVKGIAGDDLLMSNCISDFVEYVQGNPDAYFVFGKVKVFGLPTEQQNEEDEKKRCNYNFFYKTAKEQYEDLLLGCCVFAGGFFYNKQKMMELGITNDERISMIEDWPKWLRITGMGIRLSLMDKYVFKYRVGSGISNQLISPLFYKSSRQTFFYYCFPELYLTNKEKCVEHIIEQDVLDYTEMHQALIKTQKELYSVHNSYAYRIGKIVVFPVSFIRKIIKKYKS